MRESTCVGEERREKGDGEAYMEGGGERERAKGRGKKREQD